MNTELFSRIADAIEAHPQQFSMRYWHTTLTGEFITTGFVERVKKHLGIMPASCETAHCVGGWADFLTHGVRALYHPERSAGWARQLLGLTALEARLVFFGWWPEQYCGPTGTGESATAEQAVAYLREIVRTGQIPQRSVGIRLFESGISRMFGI